jgi:phosphoglucosamine mutase
MRANSYNVGGEQSGHIILGDYCTTGDGLLAALQVLAVIQQQGKAVSEVCRVFTPVPQLLKNVRYQTAGLSLDSKPVQEAIRVAEDRLGKAGRLLVRKSGTEPLIRVMAEGDDEGLITSVVQDLCSFVEDLDRKPGADVK